MAPYNFLSTTKDLPHPTIGISGNCLLLSGCQRGGSILRKYQGCSQYSRLSSSANLVRKEVSSEGTNLQSTSYSSIERSLDSPVDFQRSTLSYILPMKPLQPERYLQQSEVSKKTVGSKLSLMPSKEGPYLTGQSKSTDQSTNFQNSASGACLAFFETGSKELLPSPISHWWRDTPEWDVPTNKGSYSLSSVPPLGAEVVTVSTSNIPVTLPVSKHDAISSLRSVRSAHSYKSKSFVPAIGTFGTVGSSLNNQESPKISESLRSHDQYLTYSTVNTHTNSWNWLIWNFERHQVITGRISRPIQRAGFCVLLGGFPVFLPYGQFLCRQTWTHKKEGQLQSFQMSAFAPKGSAYGRPFPAYNCVVSRDQFIRRVAQHVSMVGITKRNKGMPHRYAVGTYGTKVEKVKE